MQHYDLIIIGNGLAGAAFIQTIHHLPLRVAVLDQHHASHDTAPKSTTENSRPITLNHASTTILKTLDIWPKLQQQSVKLDNLSITEQSRLGQIHVSAQEMGLPSLGHVTPYHLLEDQLRKQSTTLLTIDNLTSNELIKIDNKREGVTVTYRDRQQQLSLFAPLLIAADGTYSNTRDLLNITSTDCDHGDQSLVFNVTLNQPTSTPTTAYQRFTPLGSLAWLPSWSPTQARVVWTVPKHHILSINSWDDKTIARHINQTYLNRQPTIKDLQLTGQFPVSSKTHKSTVYQSTILLGNAAHTFYPITAQGFNLTLLSAAMLAENLTNSFLTYRQLNHPSYLSRYEHWSQTTQSRIALSTQRIDNIFTLPLIGHLRSLGMLATNLNPIAKKHLLSHFIGHHTSLPKLACQIPLDSLSQTQQIAHAEKNF